ncbi:MAG TPA: ATP-binding protein [Chloroflexia bacterium]|jgi:hypothetical protein
MEWNRPFPTELLLQPPKLRYDYFFDKIIAHPHLLAARKDIRRYILYPSEDRLVYVFGPTGAGKSTLARKMLQWVISDVLKDLESNPGWIPGAYAELPNPLRAIYNWTDHHISILQAIYEECIKHKVDFGENGEPSVRYTGGKLIVDRAPNPEALRRAVEHCLINRKLRALLLDEAHNLGKVGAGARGLLNQMDNMKTMANRTKTVHVLFGTYELLPLLHLSGQSSRRTAKVHLERYRIDDAAQEQVFQGIIAEFQENLPLSEEPDLVSEYKYLYQGSMGCVGLLKEWLDRALARTLEDEGVEGGSGQNDAALFRHHLDLEILSDAERIAIIQEINKGEQEVWTMNDRKGEFALHMQVRPISSKAAKEQKSVTEDTQLGNEEAQTGETGGEAGTGGKGKKGIGSKKGGTQTGTPGRKRKQVGLDMDHSDVFADEAGDAA